MTPSHNDAPQVPVLRILDERPDECACRTLTSAQVAFCLVTLALIIGAAIWRPLGVLLVINGLLIVFYVVNSAYKFYLVYLSLERPVEIGVSPEEMAAADDSALPTYTLLIPLYREARVLEGLVAGLQRMDYPTDKLDVQLLLEEDDQETIAAAMAMDLPAHIRPVVVPDSQPKTKPKACNWGLYTCHSDLLVIYDAEDRPEPDQLKKAALAFAKVPDNVVCLQAKLNYYNQRQNLLTRWFTAEYSVWFDLFLPGLTASGAPIPLGGTSNHFRVEPLKAIGGWDPFNVTEDCDLGVRLHKDGWRTAMLASTTWEEANGRLLSWIRQRSRWAKGYLQTYLVHMRHPLKLLRELGPAAFFSLQMTIGGSLVCFLFNPIYWLMTALWLLTHSPIISALFPPAIYLLGSFCLIGANFVFVYMSVAGCMQRGYYDLVKYALLTPAYWLMMSIGAYKAFAQIIVRPHYWEKTMHGFAQPDDTGGAAA
ncbi:MAG TPA: glycosyltransferase [Armatimonadota bacterium]|nr:glycosyltransferase [Armatimonadota bacterium]